MRRIVKYDVTRYSHQIDSRGAPEITPSSRISGDTKQMTMVAAKRWKSEQATSRSSKSSIVTFVRSCTSFNRGIFCDQSDKNTSVFVRKQEIGQAFSG